MHVPVLESGEYRLKPLAPPQELVELAPRIRVWLVRRNRCFITDDNQLHGAQQRRDFHYQLEL